MLVFANMALTNAEIFFLQSIIFVFTDLHVQGGPGLLHIAFLFSETSA